MGNDTELINKIKQVSIDCQMCKEFSRPCALPAVGLPLASEFNEVVAMDIKFLNAVMILCQDKKLQLFFILKHLRK